MNKDCLIIDEMHESIIPMMEEIGIRPDYRPQITNEEVMGIIGNYTGVVVRSKMRINKEFLETAVNLQYIARAGAGMDNIDVEAAKNKNIVLINAPEGNRDALAEHTLAMILTLLNRIHVADREVRNGLWRREANRGFELKDKCIALIGYGYMGRAVAKRLKSFECSVIAYDKYQSDLSDEYVREATLDEVYENADIVSLHIPLTLETRAWVNIEFYKKFKKNIWLINTARGEILPLKDLIQVLMQGKVRGAALDVLENEKFLTMTIEQKEALKFLSSQENVLLSPHVGGWTYESYYRINKVLVDKIKEAGF